MRLVRGAHDDLALKAKARHRRLIYPQRSVDRLRLT